MICALLYAKILLLFHKLYIFLFVFIMFNHPSYLSSEQIADFRLFISENRQNIELITSRLMLATGFKPHLCGSIYLREAIQYCYLRQSSAKLNFSGEVYPYIAQKTNSVARNVDRDIRTSIQACYESEKMFAFNDICGYDVISPQYPPTNSEFIMKVVSWLRTLDLERDA